LWPAQNRHDLISAGSSCLFAAYSVITHLRRAPTRAEITAARRAAHRLAASGQATILRVRPPGFDGPGSAHLILVRPGASRQGGSLDEIADASLADGLKPILMAQDLATTVELLSAAIQAVPTAHLDQSDAQKLVASLDASFEVLRQVRRHLRRDLTNST
jgi:hypothetical protein